MSEQTTSQSPADKKLGSAQGGANANPPPAANQKPEKAERKPRKVRVIDVTATAESGVRVHDLMIGGQRRSFSFKPAEPLELPLEIAVKFLKYPDTFKLVGDEGEFLTYKRQPKQPEELQAGETLTLAEHETIARFDELATAALLQRAGELPGGEKFMQAEQKPDREALVAFLIEATKQRRKANVAARPDVGEDEFVPEAEVEGEV